MSLGEHAEFMWTTNYGYMECRSWTEAEWANYYKSGGATPYVIQENNVSWNKADYGSLADRYWADFEKARKLREEKDKIALAEAYEAGYRAGIADMHKASEVEKGELYE